MTRCPTLSLVAFLMKIDIAVLENVANLAYIYFFLMEELPDGFDTVIGECGIRLNGGQRQRIGIVSSLYNNPAVLIFNEASNALDSITEEPILVAM